MKKPNLLIISLVMIACFAFSPRWAEAENNAQLLSTLDAIWAATKEIRRVIEPMDISTLSVQYKEGRLFENNRQRVLKYIRMIEEKIGAFRHKQDLTAAFFLATSLDSLVSNLESFSAQLARPITGNVNNWHEPALKWAKEVSESLTPLSEARNHFSDQVFEFMSRADARLKECR
jgi:hypothetical protein